MNTLLKNWDLLRITRLLAGLAIIVMAILEKQLILSVMGFLLLVQAIMNFGCGANGCNVQDRRKYRQ